MTNMTNEQHREAGPAHLNYMRELLEKYGDDAKLELHAAHMKSILAAVSSQREMLPSA